jgi:hypothetical protein
MTIAQNTKQSGFTSAESGIRLVKEGGNTLPDTSAHPVKNALAKFWAPVPWLPEAAILRQKIISSPSASCFEGDISQQSL